MNAITPSDYITKCTGKKVKNVTSARKWLDENEYEYIWDYDSDNVPEQNENDRTLIPVKEPEGVRLFEHFTTEEEKEN